MADDMVAMSAHLLHGFERFNLQKARQIRYGMLEAPAEASGVADRGACATPNV